MKVLENCLEKIQSLNAYSFYWKNKSNPHGLQYGLNADEVYDLNPDIIVMKDGFKTVNYNAVLALLLGSVKEILVKLNM